MTRGIFIFAVAATVGFALGLGAGREYVANEDLVARAAQLETSLELCDTNVLRAEIALEKATEEFWEWRARAEGSVK
jgi:hypothetical protein